MKNELQVIEPQQLYENWVNSLNINTIQDNRCIEVMARFEQFKRWALGFKNN